MNEFAAWLEMLPVNLLHWIVGFISGLAAGLLRKTLEFFGYSLNTDPYLPTFETLLSMLIMIGTIIGVFCTLFAIVVIIERKGLGRIQNRLGPNRVGPFGIFQPVADGIKMLIKEDIVPASADHLLHFLAPVILVFGSLISFSVIPFGKNLFPIELECGLIFYFAGGAASEFSIFLAGWSSHNKYSLLGAMRALAQLLSYEIPLILSAVPVVMLSSSLDPVQIVGQQTGYTWLFIPNWFVCTPWGAVGFLLFFIASLAETNRSPFDLPEAESELIAGHLTEYSGFKYALFFMAEYLAMISISSIGITLFLGGWHAPFGFLEFIPSYFWFGGKLITLLWMFIWIRATVPRLRIDQLMAFAWKFMIPLGLINILVAAFWYKSLAWAFNGAIGLRYGIAIAVLAGCYYFLAQLLSKAQPSSEKRTYRYAE